MTYYKQVSNSYQKVLNQRIAHGHGQSGSEGLREGRKGGWGEWEVSVILSTIKKKF